MKQVRIWASGLAVGPLLLDSEAAHYLSRVHRLPEGAEVVIFDHAACLVAQARLVRVSKSGSAVEVEILSVAPSQETILPVSLLTCLGKGDKPEQALREATVLGARRVILVQSERVQGRQSGREVERQKKVMLDAARQSGRVSLPEVFGPLPLAECLEKVGGIKLELSLDPDAQPLLRRLERWQADVELALLIGPEGGLTLDERRALGAAGFLPASLGPLVLRAETAVTVALGVARAAALLQS